MNLIQVNILHKKDEDKDHPHVQSVEIIYPFQEGTNFKGKDIFTPREGHLEVNYGLYGRSGFFNNTLHIIGECGNQRREKKLPLSACDITDYFNL